MFIVYQTSDCMVLYSFTATKTAFRENIVIAKTRC